MTKLRTELTLALSRAITQLIDSYTAFAADRPSRDPKPFSEHHAACRAALVHLDLLVKIAKLAGADSSRADTTATRRLIRNAPQAIAQAEHGDSDDRDDPG